MSQKYKQHLGEILQQGVPFICARSKTARCFSLPKQKLVSSRIYGIISAGSLASWYNINKEEFSRALFKKIFAGLLLCAMLLALQMPITASEEGITVLYTNDIHTYMANDRGSGNESKLTYSKLASLKNSIPNAILVDAGDHIQGTAYGGMDNGATILRLMNAPRRSAITNLTTGWTAACRPCKPPTFPTSPATSATRQTVSPATGSWSPFG